MHYYVLTFIVLSAIVVSSATNRTDSVSEIFAFLDECSRDFKLGEQKEVVVLLGNTGCGKSTLTLLLTGAPLIAVETDEGSGEFVVKDSNSLISPPEQTTKSQTVIPNLLIDNEFHTSYYDSAGFEDSRGVDHDISVTYLIRKLLQHAHSVKFVFAVAYPSVKIGGDRHDFKKLARHATALIKNLPKYRDAIALVVTKVEPKISNGQIVNDEKTIENIGKFLSQVQSDLNNEDVRVREKMATFIGILLQKNANQLYDRIQIVRAPTESGQFNEMPLVKAERQAIRTMLRDTIQYVDKQNDDFGYSISSESKLRIHGLFEELENSLTSDVISIGNDIVEFYQQQATQTPDKQLLTSNLISTNKMLLQIDASDLNLFKEQLVHTISALQVDVSADSLNGFDRHIEFVHFLGSVSDEKLSNHFEISSGFKNISKYFSELVERYKSVLVAELKANLTTTVSNIDDEIKSFYSQMESDILDVSVLYNKIHLAHSKLAEIATKDPSRFESQLVESINSLHVKIAADALKQFSKHLEVIQFLETLNDDYVAIEIENGLTHTMQYLAESQQWYNFSMDLYGIFSEFSVQQNVRAHNAIVLQENINRLIEHADREHSQIKFDDTGIKEFINRISGGTTIKLENIKLNSIKLKSFNRLLDQHMIERISTLCTANELIVKGNYIKMSEVVGVECTASLIRVLAIFKVFIDVDVDKAEKELHIISPEWEVVGERRIDLSGRPGASYDYPAPNGDRIPGANGMAGKAGGPGKPGESAGHFFGVGDSFKNEQNLEIFANGGNGGAGQNGGNGSYAVANCDRDFVLSKLSKIVVLMCARW